MSFTELKEQVAQLTPSELAELREVIDAAETGAAVRRATPEMLAERRRLMDQVLTGEWSADLPPWQETRALEKARGISDRLFASPLRCVAMSMELA